MAIFDFKLPDIGEGVTEGEIVAWSVKVGDVVKEDDPMVEVMTDKATVTIGAPKAGRIASLGGAVGQVVKVGAVLVQIELGAAPVAHAAPAANHAQPAMHTAVASGVPAAPAAKSDGPAATAVGDIRESLPGSSFFTKKAPAAPAVAAAPAAAAAPVYFSEKPLATPATRKLARDAGVDLRHVRPTGANGRVTREDVQAFAAKGASAAPDAQAHAYAQVPAEVRGVAAAGATSSIAAAPGTSGARAPIAVVAPTPAQAARETRKPFVGIRRKIAERMQTSKNTAAHFTFVEECDVTRLKELHARLKPHADARDTKLTYLPFIVKAVVAALKRAPILNSALDEVTNELVTRHYYNIGIAASTDQGLMVPVVRDADTLSILEVSREIDRLGRGARAGTLSSAELTGSTFTVTSLGKQGGLFATPILNFPEVGILGVHQIKQRPVVRDGQIVIGEVMLLSLSFDHRIVDGHVGAAFAYDIIGMLEEPDRLFLELA
jgi:pyruvate dehydrogenase E2 component (dihydrolipoamide acetyltransferase)